MVAVCAAALEGDAKTAMLAQRDAIAGAFLASKDGPPTVRFIWGTFDHFLDHVERGRRRRIAEERAAARRAADATASLSRARLAAYANARRGAHRAREALRLEIEDEPCFAMNHQLAAAACRNVGVRRSSGGPFTAGDTSRGTSWRHVRSPFHPISQGLSFIVWRAGGPSSDEGTRPHIHSRRFPRAIWIRSKIRALHESRSLSPHALPFAPLAIAVLAGASGFRVGAEWQFRASAGGRIEIQLAAVEEHGGSKVRKA
ncbi:MAG: hypothetical protein ACRENE_29515, partial [Polyangiaceae bacterium]